MCLGDISVRSLAAHSQGVRPPEKLEDFIRLFRDCLGWANKAGSFSMRFDMQIGDVFPSPLS
jgi:hypothetical protein